MPRRLELILLALVLIVAAVLRLGWPGLTEFKADEARLMLLALEMVEEGGLPLRGISSSVGFPNFPMSVWLYALPLYIWPHPLAATLFTGFLNLLAVGGTYWLVRRYWGPHAALAAALLFAVNPWALHHARKIWAQNLLAPFVVGWGISGALFWVEERPSFIIPHLLCLAIAAQAHLAGLALVPATLLILLLNRRRLRLRDLLLGGGLVLLTLLPFLLYLYRSGISLLNALPGGGGAASGGWDWHAFRLAWLLSSGREIHALAGPEAFERYLANVPDLTAVQLFWGMLMAGGLLLLLMSLRRSDAKVRRLSGLLLLWLLAPLLLFSWPRLPRALHYLLPMYPVPFILAGIGAAWLWRRIVVSAGRWALWGGVIGGALLQIWIWGALLQFVSQTATPGGFGVSLQRQLAATARVVEQMQASGAAELLIAGAGDNPAEESFPAVYDVLLREWPHRFVDGRETAVFPAAPAVVLISPEAPAAVELYRRAAAREILLPLRAGEGALTVMTLSAAQPQPEIPFAMPHILTNWAAFAGVDAPQETAGGEMRWQVYWYAGERADVDFHLFNHLLDGEGNRLAQADTAVFPARQWQDGDLVITRLTLPLLPAVESVRMGMYRYPELEPVLVFDVAGNPTADGVTVPLP